MENRGNISLIIRIGLGATLFVVGFNLANTAFFNDYPLFGVRFLAEVLISTVGALIGFYLIPRYFIVIKEWLEQLVINTTQRLVSDFWNQYNQRADLAKRQRELERKRKQEKKEKRSKFKDKIQNGVLLDTSVLIDGRVLEIAKTGFFLTPLIIPKFVIEELHLLADNKNEIKRKKGRRGLDMINDLKKEAQVVIYNQKQADNGVDEELVELAKDCKLSVMTLDFNLNKVAKVSSIKVLNLNELVEALKPQFVPGEALKIKIIQKGKEKGQGVGYLDDGTMIVVDKADKKVGELLDVEVVKLIQTNAGKMVFCDISSK